MRERPQPQVSEKCNPQFGGLQNHKYQCFNYYRGAGVDLQQESAKVTRARDGGLLNIIKMSTCNLFSQANFEILEKIYLYLAL